MHTVWQQEFMKRDTHVLTDTIKQVEKLQTAQQPTATIIPASTVNMMSNKEDQCLQCQESGHIAQHCPYIQCYKCDKYGHIIMDCPHIIPPSGTPGPHHRAHRHHHNRSSSRSHHEDQGSRDRSKS